MIFPAFNDAKNDRELRGSPISVYLYLLDELSPVDWRDLPQLSLCVKLGYSERTVRDALDVLVSHGYLERDEDVAAHAGVARRFRLVYSRAPRQRAAAFPSP